MYGYDADHTVPTVSQVCYHVDQYRGANLLDIASAWTHPVRSHHRQRLLRGEGTVEQLDIEAEPMPDGVETFLWEDAEGVNSDSGIPPLNLTDALILIERVCSERGFSRAVMTPVGFEDEGVALKEFLRRPGLPVNLDVRFRYDLDLADLRGWQNT